MLLAVLGAAACVPEDTIDLEDEEEAGFELGCRVEIQRQEPDGRFLSVLEYDQHALLVRWRGGLEPGATGDRVYAWNAGGTAASWSEIGSAGETRTTTVTYAGGATAGARLPLAADTRTATGFTAARREYRHEDGRVSGDGLIADGSEVVTRTYDYGADGLLDRMTTEYDLDEAAGPEVIDEAVFRRDPQGRVIRTRLLRDGVEVDVIDHQLDEAGLPVRIEHSTGVTADLLYFGSACRQAAASWRLAWPDPLEP